ncbi:MAG: protein phosphatase 2C domain-containing protein [Nitrospira sp.]|nr:protein phosphatase 2C domain-containing protein [Nitrospira sp.]
MQNTRWRVIGGTVQGSGHEKKGIPCQDAHAWNIVDDDCLVLAVADGAGSAPLADVGSKLAVNHAVRFLVNSLKSSQTNGSALATKESWHTIACEMLKSTRDVITEEAKARQRDAGELASTLIVVVVAPCVTAAAQVGDGAVVVQSEGAIRSFTKPPPTQYPNEATFLVSSDAIETAQFVIEHGPSESLALFSDGLQMLALEYPEWNPFIPFFRPVFDFVREHDDEDMARAELEATMKSPRIRQRSSDDITLVLATRMHPAKQSNFTDIKETSAETKEASMPGI